MSYTSIISVEDAKDYLGVDDSFHDDDIQRMIKASLQCIEKYTNHIFFDRSKDYLLMDGEVSVYDYPINSVVTPGSEDDYESKEHPLHTVYTVSDTDLVKITLNVGYSDADDVPDDLIQVAFEKIDAMFNNTSKPLSMNCKMILDQNKRFLI